MSVQPEPTPGALFLSEIREQPLALERLLAYEDAYRAAGEALRRRPPAVVRMVGHGSSDNAASYGVYAFGLLPGWTAMRDSISLSVYYGARVDLAASCVLALSQSGRTPDVVEYVERARAQGALTIAVTNDPESVLADASEVVLPLAAGDERAVAATKTYTTQLAALALLAAHAAGEGAAYADGIRATADLLARVLPQLERRVAEAARALTFVERLFSIGRGPEFATAREFALKLLETCRIGAEPFTATDFSHGPVAAVDALFPVWAFVSDDVGLPIVLEAVARARAAGATVIASGTRAAALHGAAYRLPVPEPPLPLLSPLLSIAPGQLAARALALARGLDPDRPDGLSKVTLAL